MNWYVDTTGGEPLRHVGTVHGDRVSTRCARSFPAHDAAVAELGHSEMPVNACVECAVYANQAAGLAELAGELGTRPRERGTGTRVQERGGAVTRGEALAMIIVLGLLLVVVVAGWVAMS